MPTSSIADEITRLSSCRNNILSAISAKGVTVPVGSVLSSCPSLIASITGGGGGEPTSFINSSFDATGRYTFTRPFTATQVATQSYRREQFESNFNTAQVNGYLGVANGNTFFPVDGTPAELAFSGSRAQWQDMPTGGTLYSASSTNVYGFTAAIGDWTATTSTTSFTARAQFTASAAAPTPFYIVFGNLSPWSLTANQPMSGVRYVVTGTELPYPQYAITSEGTMSGETTGREYWSGTTTFSCRLDRSASISTTYNDGPSTSSAQGTPIGSSLSSYSAGQLRSYLTGGSYGPNDTGYSYVYGAVTSGYTGYTGI